MEVNYLEFEIGSEFEFDYESIMSKEPKNLEQELQLTNYKLVSSGRCGIKQILLNLINKNDGKNEFLLPAYLCPSIAQPFKELNLKIVYYNILPNLTIDLEDLKSKLHKKTKCVYFLHYFGVLQPQHVISYLSEIKQRNICLIEDITHNFFSKRADIGDYLVGSLRKWAPLPHGGLVIVNKKQEEYKTWYENPKLALKIGQQRSFGQQLKFLYLNSLNNQNLKKEYLNILRNMEQALYSHIEIAPMDQLSANMLIRMDFGVLSKKRRDNYKFLYHHLKTYKEFDLVIGDIGNDVTPLGFQIVLENRNDLRDYLVKNGVYASVHWNLPQEVQSSFGNLTDLSKKILTIPCDQRYGESEMEYIVKLIQAYFSKVEGRGQRFHNEVGELYEKMSRPNPSITY